jgi:formylglycine-generating enzyme required for sulfatase activity
MAEANAAQVSAFRLDKYLVTVGRFRQFVSAWNSGSGYTPPAGSGKHTHLNQGNGLSAVGGGYEPGWIASDNSQIAPTTINLRCDIDYAPWTAWATTNENYPLNCANWWEAYAFCIWDGGFLPSEAELAYAAAGGSEQREYPWGSAVPGKSSQYAIFGCNYPSATGVCTGLTNIGLVGAATSGAGRWGQQDLAGDLWERVLDWYAPYTACIDCTNFSPTANQVLRGGGFDDDGSTLSPADRGLGTPGLRARHVGFRCARSP